MPERPYLSIGEVLELLRAEFPDVTISKIRFLESQGLLEPERTASGYRKFYEGDVDRLRFILTQQREKYLPLRVIREQLERRFPSGGPHDDGDEAGHAGAPTDADDWGDPGEPIEDEPARAPEARNGGGAGSGREALRALLSGAASGVSLTLDELVAASGLSRDDVKQLESFGLVNGHPVFSATYYDEEALLVAKLAAGFRRYGVEPRHLRMYKTAADREAAFLEQVVTPLVRRRTPETRQQALDALGELVRLGEQLRAAALRRVLRSAVDQG